LPANEEIMFTLAVRPQSTDKNSEMFACLIRKDDVLNGKRHGILPEPRRRPHSHDGVLFLPLCLVCAASLPCLHCLRAYPLLYGVVSSP
jgi:hypothetical protein